VEIPIPLAANFSPFNTLLLFAPFLCNIVFPTPEFCSVRLLLTFGKNAGEKFRREKS
jgi:hypothetical protein